jgi:hypothetical protein
MANSVRAAAREPARVHKTAGGPNEPPTATTIFVPVPRPFLRMNMDGHPHQPTAQITAFFL